MVDIGNVTVDTDKLIPSLKQYVRAELGLIYAYAVKNVRLIALGAFGFFVFTASAFIGLVLFVMGILLKSGATINAIGNAALILGGIVIVGVVGFTALAINQRFWMRLFKLDEIVTQARLRNETILREAHT